MTEPIPLNPQDDYGVVDAALGNAENISPAVEGVASLRILDIEDTTYAIAPGEAVTSHTVQIPTRSDAQARSAAGFALEDDLAVDLNDVHIAIGPPSDGNVRQALVAGQSTMRAWVTNLGTLGVQPALLVPEYAALAVESDELVIVDRGDTVVLASETFGCTVAPDLLRLLSDTLSSHVNISKVRLYSDYPAALELGPIARGANIDSQPALSDEGYEYLMVSGIRAAKVNLLQGAYSVRPSLSQLMTRWAVPVCMAVLFAVSYLGLLVSEGIQFERQATSLWEQSEDVFRDALPDVRRIVNPRVQLQSRINEIGGGQGSPFLSMAAVLTEAMRTSGRGQLESLQFDSSRGHLSATIILPSYADVELLHDRVLQMGFLLEEGGTQTRDGQIISDVIVRAP